MGPTLVKDMLISIMQRKELMDNEKRGWLRYYIMALEHGNPQNSNGSCSLKSLTETINKTRNPLIEGERE